jgi:methyltransferase (TIGR00027 family)
LRTNRPSRTAFGVALHRAAHQLLDRPLVFRDPVALVIIGPEARAALDANPRRYERRFFGASLRAHLVARSRIAEDALAAAVSAGVRQYVVLGAGLDTFALRNTELSLRVFEVDHPNTQAWKRKRLEAAGRAQPPNVVFVPVDFERQDLSAELARAGFDTRRPSFFSWLGVTPYLEEPAIWDTLRWVGSTVGDGGGIVFDYGAPPSRWNLSMRIGLWALSARVASAGEPFRTFLAPEAVASGLRRCGFAAVEDLDRMALNRRYFAGRGDGLEIRGTAHVVIALHSRVRL